MKRSKVAQLFTGQYGLSNSETAEQALTIGNLYLRRQLEPRRPLKFRYLKKPQFIDHRAGYLWLDL